MSRSWKAGTALSALAAVTSRIRLATPATVASYRNPAHLAKIAASVGLISHGRLTIGIGAGFFEDEYKHTAGSSRRGLRHASGRWRKPCSLRNDEESRELFVSDVMPHFA